MGRSKFRPVGGGTWHLDAGNGTFVLVEGRVISVRQSGGTVYVNFGRCWTRDFTLTVPRGLGPLSAKPDVTRRCYKGAPVRGWLERRTGPIIEREQIELLE